MRQLLKSRCKVAVVVFFGCYCQFESRVLSTELYDFGNPTSEEQFNLELINRARANPPVEGIRLAEEAETSIVDAYNYFSVNLTLMKSEFAVIAAQPPCAPNLRLTQSARSHSQWMLAHDLQAHDEIPGQPGGDIGERVSLTGYPWIGLAENIFAYAQSSRQSHASFETDWGYYTDGMQAGRRDRVNIHSANYREIGIGFVNGSNLKVGPKVVTQEFGLQPSSPVFATGVVYFDLNANGAYDEGEGLPGVLVTGSQSAYHCYTASGGGWALPLPRLAGAQTITYQCADFNQTANITVNAALENVKSDVMMNYEAPVITSSSTATLGLPFQLAFTQPPGISQDRLQWWTAAPAADENAENVAKIVATLSPGYALLNTVVKQQGGSAFHLANPTGRDQLVELNQTYYATSSASVTFQSRLRLATADQTALVEVQPDGEEIWQTIFSQYGSGGAGETAFVLRTVNLTGLSGKIFRLRFRFAFHSGSYYSSTSNSIGWFIDAISLPGVLALDNYQSATVSASTASFVPSVLGSLVVGIQPLPGGRISPGSTKVITVNPATGFVAWALQQETSAGLAPGVLALRPDADYDEDGRVNFWEYAYDLNPLNPGDGVSTLPQVSYDGSDLRFEYTANLNKPDVHFRPEVFVGDQTAWLAPGALIGFTDTLLTTTGSLQRRRASLPLGNARQYLFRLAVQKN